MRVFLFILRVILGAVFILASVDKILHPASFALSVDKYQLLPPALTPVTAVSLPWVELLAGVALAAGIGVEGAALVAFGLLAVFLGGMGINLARGRELDCGCFGFLLPNEQVGAWSLLRDGTLLVIAGALTFVGRRSWGAGWLGKRLRRRTGNSD